MEIEVRTTTKKLSKSIINQMRSATLASLLDGEVLGYVVKIVKNSYKTIIIKHNGEYFVETAGWKKGEEQVYRRVGRWSHQKKFNTAEDCTEWWTAYQNALNKAQQIYI